MHGFEMEEVAVSETVALTDSATSQQKLKGINGKKKMKVLAVVCVGLLMIGLVTMTTMSRMAGSTPERQSRFMEEEKSPDTARLSEPVQDGLFGLEKHDPKMMDMETETDESHPSLEVDADIGGGAKWVSATSQRCNSVCASHGRAVVTPKTGKYFVCRHTQKVKSLLLYMPGYQRIGTNKCLARKIPTHKPYAILHSSFQCLCEPRKRTIVFKPFNSRYPGCKKLCRSYNMGYIFEGARNLKTHADKRIYPLCSGRMGDGYGVGHQYLSSCFIYGLEKGATRRPDPMCGCVKHIYDGVTQFYRCPPGLYKVRRITYGKGKGGGCVCKLCPKGYACPGNNKKEICQCGTYQPKKGQAKCFKPACGYYVPKAGSWYKIKCNYGTYAPKGRQRNCQCKKSRPGFSVPTRGACKPLRCKRNTAQYCSGQMKCIPCGKYSSASVGKKL